jgi:hypothetical protein
MKKARAARLLARMAAIERMERGKVCRLTGRAHYNHQTWRDGRNIVRYVRADQVAALRQAIAGYQRFRKLAEAYADEIIRRTRAERRPSPPARSRRHPGKTG